MKITEREMLVTLANMALRMDDLTGHDVIEVMRGSGTATWSPGHQVTHRAQTPN